MDPTRIQHEVTPGKRVFPMMHPTPRHSAFVRWLPTSVIGVSSAASGEDVFRHGPAQRLATPPRPAAPWLQGNGCRPRAAWPLASLSCRARTCARPECRLPQRLCAPDMPRALRNSSRRSFRPVAAHVFARRWSCASSKWPRLSRPRVSSGSAWSCAAPTASSLSAISTSTANIPTRPLALIERFASEVASMPGAKRLARPCVTSSQDRRRPWKRRSPCCCAFRCRWAVTASAARK